MMKSKNKGGKDIIKYKRANFSYSVAREEFSQKGLFSKNMKEVSEPIATTGPLHMLSSTSWS